jgi:phage tail sheath protein FI
MAVSPTYPGVYIDEVSSGVRPIESASTSTACFIGMTARKDAHVGVPKLVFRLAEYKEFFGFAVKKIVATAVILNETSVASAAVTATVDGNKVAAAAISESIPLKITSEEVTSKVTVTVDSKKVDLIVTTTLINEEPTSIVAAAVDGKPIDPTVTDGELDGNKVTSTVTMTVDNKVVDVEVISTFCGMKVDSVATATVTVDRDKEAANSEVTATVYGRKVASEFTVTIGKEVTQKDVKVTLLVAATLDGTKVTDSEVTATLCGKNVPASLVVSGSSDSEKKVTLQVDAEVVDIWKPDIMGLAVYTFFLNGGGAAYIVNVGKDADPAKYAEVITSLEKIRDISIICLPGKSWRKPDSEVPGIAVDNGIIYSAITHAELMKNCMVIVDLGQNVELNSLESVNDLVLPSKEFTVTYYPWLEVANPLYKEDPENPSQNPPPATFTIAPSSFAAGMWAKIDGRRGVWKSPAGVETALLGVAGLAFDVDNKLQGELNPLGINCIRKIPGAGPVIWGSRTLATKADPEWRYVPVRRTACMIEESIFNNIQWAVFEPNDHRLWSSLRVNIDAFMNGLWRAGAFQGEKASDAYFVRCNLGDTMTQDDIDLGKVIVDVGFAPLKPAEFVIIRIQQKVAQQ